MYKKLAVYIVGLLCTGMSLTGHALLIPSASDWSASVTTLSNRGSGDPNTYITDITNGVLLHYDAPTGGRGSGTTLRQYDYTTTAAATGAFNFDFDVAISASTGFFVNELFLGVVQNNAVVLPLIHFSHRQPSSINRTFNDLHLNLAAGDTWGLRIQAGNFTACCGVKGDGKVTGVADVTKVPEPGTGVLAILGIAVLGLMIRQQRARNFNTLKPA